MLVIACVLFGHDPHVDHHLPSFLSLLQLFNNPFGRHDFNLGGPCVASLMFAILMILPIIVLMLIVSFLLLSLHYSY